MNQTIDNLIAARMLYLLIQPFKQTQAYKLGIIDAEGKVLKKQKELKTKDEKDAYNYLHRVIFKVKRLLLKATGNESQVVNALAAYVTVKEEVGGTAIGVAAGGYGNDVVVAKRKRVHPLFRRFVKMNNE
jgi:hypothetical protein